VSNLPAAYLITAGFDPLCDEGAAYAERLKAFGVAVQHMHLPAQIHGFMTMGKLIPAAGAATEAAGAALRAAFG
jgi:acetyl esterase